MSFFLFTVQELSIKKKFKILAVFTWKVSKDKRKLVFFGHFSDQNRQNLNFFWSGFIQNGEQVR